MRKLKNILAMILVFATAASVLSCAESAGTWTSAGQTENKDHGVTVSGSGTNETSGAFDAVIREDAVSNENGDAETDAGSSSINEDSGNDGMTYPDTELETSESAVNFALKLLAATAESKEGESVVISPYSVLSALAMTANGAVGDTLSEMETAIGMRLSDLNEYLPAYASSLPSSEGAKLTDANSVWIRDDGALHVDQAFIGNIADLYRADTFTGAFSAGDINEWISDNTDGRIANMLDEMPGDDVMFLVNAVLFDALWDEAYYENEIRRGTFTNAEGKDETVELMYKDGFNGGFALDGAVGFVRHYAGNTYDFVAILPDEGTTPGEYLKALDVGTFLTGLHDLCPVRTCMPKFAIDTEIDMKPVLAAFGMRTPFDPNKADFSGIGKYRDDNLYISKVIHRAMIKADGLGTEAGAATVVAMAPGAAGPGTDSEIMTVYLTRPFIFMVTDTATHTPIFCGIVNSVA